MDTSKVGNWLQIVGNFGLIAGLILVGFQINQNTKITTEDLRARSFEQIYQYQLTMMGENPSKAVAKAATNANKLTDEELMVLQRIASFWFNFDTQLEIQVQSGFADRELALNYWRGRATGAWGANPVFAAIWEEQKAGIGDYEWVRVVDEQIKNTEHDADSRTIGRLRKVAMGVE